MEALAKRIHLLPTDPGEEIHPWAPFHRWKGQVLQNIAHGDFTLWLFQVYCYNPLMLIFQCVLVQGGMSIGQGQLPARLPLVKDQNGKISGTYRRKVMVAVKLNIYIFFSYWVNCFYWSWIIYILMLKANG